MIEKLKSAGTIGLAVVGVIAAIVVLPLLFVKGAIWASEHLLGYLILASWLVFFFDLLILLPLSLFRRLRPHTGLLIYLSSYLFGLATWLFGFIVTYALWGGFAVICGLMFFGVGVVFMAATATMFKGMWGMLVSVVSLTVATYSSRLVGLMIAIAAPPSEDIASVPNHLRYELQAER